MTDLVNILNNFQEYDSRKKARIMKQQDLEIVKGQIDDTQKALISMQQIQNKIDYEILQLQDEEEQYKNILSISISELDSLYQDVKKFLDQRLSTPISPGDVELMQLKIQEEQNILRAYKIIETRLYGEQRTMGVQRVVSVGIVTEEKKDPEI